MVRLQNKYQGKRDSESVQKMNEETQLVYEKYGSVKAPVVAHISANIVAILATNYNAFEWIMADKMRSGVLTVACAAIAAAMYVFIQRMEDEI